MTKKGFFDAGGIFRPEDLRAVLPSTSVSYSSHRDCASCGLDKRCRTPRMGVSGGGKRKILIIAEAPGREEDVQGTQLVGRVGRYLERKLRKLGIDLHKDCYKINAVNCRPPKNRTPTPKEIACCRPRVWEVIAEKKPRHILLLGSAAIESFLGERYSRSSSWAIGTWRGWVIPDQDVRAFVYPTYHPSFALRMEGQIGEKIFLDDLHRFAYHVKEASRLSLPVPENTTEKVAVLEDEEEAASMINKIRREQRTIAFDYETTGLKPHASGHGIVCCSIAYDRNHSFAFFVTRKTRKPLVRILRDARVPKVAHNARFEIAWSKEILGVFPRSVVWDTMLVAHLLDNRSGVTSLKFQAYVNFGIIGYDAEIDEYLKSTGKSANSFNRVRDLSVHPEWRRKLLTYCGIDSLLTYRLWEAQSWQLQRRKALDDKSVVIGATR